MTLADEEKGENRKLEITFVRIKPLCMCMLLIISVTFSTIMISTGGQTSTTQLFVSPPKTEWRIPALGETFKVNASIDDVSDLQSFEFKLYWNTTLLDLVEAEPQPFLKPLWVITKNEIDEVLGRYWLNVTSMADPPGANGSGPLVTLTFRICCEPVWPENVTCALDLADTKLVDSGGGLISHDVYDGEYWCYSTPLLSITTTTDKPLYAVNETIYVYGNMTLDCSPVPDGLVALGIDGPFNKILVIRTLSVGIPPANQTVEIIDVIPCGGPPDYNPRSWFNTGTMAYFNVTVKNNDIKSRRVLSAINVYDANLTALGTTAFETSVPSGSILWGTCSFYIPETASIGDATVYTSALTGLPRNGGTAYCPEENATFEIREMGGAGATIGSPQIQSNSPEGTYNLTFRMPPDARAGIYQVSASASYQEQTAKSRTAFGVSIILVPDHYPTIQAAVDAASVTNNSILVTPGTYDEHVTINKPITLVGRDPSRTVVNGGGTGTVVTVIGDNVTISLFKIRNSGSLYSDSGVALKNSSGSTISENAILKNYYGINVHLSDNNSILDNTVSRNNYGIYLNHSTSNTLENNIMMCNKYNFGVLGDSISDFTHIVGTSNTVNGKPVVYWVDRHNSEVPSNAGFVAVVSSTNIAVRSLKLKRNVQGVLLAFTNYSVIERVNTLSNEYGIYLAYSYRNTIIGNRVSNSSVGIYLRNSNKSNIYHNNLINNKNQVERYQASNTWDDGGLWLCPICGQPQPEGNYWSDYTGLDNGASTQAHNCPGDGVGDTLTPHLEVDKYPLMEPWILVYDVAITTVTSAIPCNASHVYARAGWTVTVTVTVKNKGDSIQTFNVSAYANTTTIQTQTVTLPVRSLTPVTFTWNIDENVATGNYTIWAYATPVLYETRKADNTYVDGTVRVNIPGDAKEPFGTVNILDIVYVSLAFDAERMPNCTYWHTPPCTKCPHDPINDINMDGFINILDLVIVAINWTE